MLPWNPKQERERFAWDEGVQKSDLRLGLSMTLTACFAAGTIYIELHSSEQECGGCVPPSIHL